jgi:hypothetical protein
LTPYFSLTVRTKQILFLQVPQYPRLSDRPVFVDRLCPLGEI